MSGQGKMVLDGYVRKSRMGDVIVIFPETKRSLRAITDIER